MVSYQNGTTTWIYWTTTTGTATVGQGPWAWETTTASTTGTSYEVWSTWQSVGTVSDVRFVYPSARLTEEQIAAQRRLREEAAAVAAEAKKLREEAEAKARELLAEVLSEEQEREYAETKAFTIQVRDPRDRRFRTFRVNHGRAGNVTELDDAGRPRSKYCIHLTDGSPAEDTMVMQKLLLESDIEEFERIANRSPVYA